MRVFLLVWTVLAVWILLLPAQRVTPHKTLTWEFAILAFVLLVHLTAHPIAYGKATDDGVLFRRYLQQQFLPWSDFTEIVWKPGWISLRLRDKSYPANRLHFIENTAWTDLWLKFRGQTPQKVAWLQSKVHEP
jgi:hypothetical protein